MTTINTYTWQINELVQLVLNSVLFYRQGLLLWLQMRWTQGTSTVFQKNSSAMRRTLQEARKCKMPNKEENIVSEYE